MSVLPDIRIKLEQKRQQLDTLAKTIAGNKVRLNASRAIAVVDTRSTCQIRRRENNAMVPHGHFFILDPRGRFAQENKSSKEQTCRSFRAGERKTQATCVRNRNRR